MSEKELNGDFNNGNKSFSLVDYGDTDGEEERSNSSQKSAKIDSAKNGGNGKLDEGDITQDIVAGPQLEDGSDGKENVVLQQSGGAKIDHMEKQIGKSHGDNVLANTAREDEHTDAELVAVSAELKEATAIAVRKRELFFLTYEMSKEDKLMDLGKTVNEVLEVIAKRKSEHDQRYDMLAVKRRDFQDQLNVEKRRLDEMAKMKMEDRDEDYGQALIRQCAIVSKMTTEMDKQIYKVNLDIQAERTRFEEERKKLWNELLPMAERINMELVALKNKSYAENVLPFFKHVTELAHKKRRLSEGKEGIVPVSSNALDEEDLFDAF